MKVSDIISDFLINRNITTVFGIIGSANSHLYDSFSKAGINILNVHNEQCAVIAAGAYFRTCGKLAAALITAGGGVTNSVTGIVSLWADSIPAIIISGQESSNYITMHSHRRMYGTQGLDIVHMVSKVTKYAKVILDANEIQDELEKSYAITLDGRKGPVLLDVPFDIQSKSIGTRLWESFRPTKKIPTDEEINQVVKLLECSKNPIILGGHGIKLADAQHEFNNLINSLKIPVLLTWSAIDVIGHDNFLYFGSPGIYGQRAANFIFQKCDLLIVLGSRLTLPQTGYDFKEVARGAKIVMVDIDPTEFKEFSHLQIHADCGEFIKRINVKCHRPEWVDECVNIRTCFPLITHECHPEVDTDFPNSYRLIDKISDFLTPNHIVVTDMGTALLSGHQVIRLKEGAKMFSSYGLGEMGYGLPAAFGAAIAGNGREVLCLNCDGGMMMNIQELQTIIQHKLRVKIIIFNNDGYLMIKHTQKMLFGGKHTAVNNESGIVLPNYMKVAKAFGYQKYQIKNWKDFNFYFPQFMEFDGPSICEIFMPVDQDFSPKVKGVIQSNGSIFAPPIEEMSPLLSFDTVQKVMGSAISKKSSEIAR